MKLSCRPTRSCSEQRLPNLGQRLLGRSARRLVLARAVSLALRRRQRLPGPASHAPSAANSKAPSHAAGTMYSGNFSATRAPARNSAPSTLCPAPATTPTPPTASRPGSSSRATTTASCTRSCSRSCCLDLSQLNPVSTNLYLIVYSPQVLQVPVFPPPAPCPPSGTSASLLLRKNGSATNRSAVSPAPASNTLAPIPLPQCTTPPSPPLAPAANYPSNTYTRVFQIGRPIETTKHSKSMGQAQ